MLLARAVRSVLAQGGEAQACVFDNASGDETAAVARGLASEGPVHYYAHAQNVGAYENFQHALGSVETPFFSILSDDDYLLPGFYGLALALFERFPEAGMVCARVVERNARGELRPERAMRGCPEGLHPAPEGLRAMARRGPTTWTGIVFRREVRQHVGPLDVAVGAACDVDFVLRAAARFPFVVSRQPGAVFVPASIAETRSLRADPRAFWPGWGRMVERFRCDPELPPRLREDVAAALMLQLRSFLGFIGAAAVVRGDFEDARRAAATLRDVSGAWARAGALEAAVAACRWPPVHGAARGLFHLRQSLRSLAHRTFRGAGGRLPA